jgi:hypothetical protein
MLLQEPLAPSSRYTPSMPLPEFATRAYNTFGLSGWTPNAIRPTFDEGKLLPAKTNFVISITPGATNLDSFTLQQINGLIQSKAVKYAITDTNAKILTLPTGITAFRQVSYDGMKNDNVPLKGAAIFFVNGGTGYSLLYLAKQTEYTQNLPMVQQMVNSFQVGSGAASGGGAPVQNAAAAASR